MKLKHWGLSFVFLFNTAFAATPWCGYSEFVQGRDNLKSQAQIDVIRSNKCMGQAGQTGVPTQITVKSLDGTKECVVQNTTIGSNLFKLKTDPCDKDCQAAYKAIQMEDPETIRTNPDTRDIYVKLFGCS